MASSFNFGIIESFFAENLACLANNLPYFGSIRKDTPLTLTIALPGYTHWGGSWVNWDCLSGR